MTTVVSKPKIEKRRKTKHVGLRVRVPMRGMSKEIVKLRKLSETWFETTGVKPAGAPFVRYYVIDMAGEMDIDYGIPVGRVGVIRPPMMGGELPAGEYACLANSGSGVAGNKAYSSAREPTELSGTGGMIPEEMPLRRGMSVS